MNKIALLLLLSLLLHACGGLIRGQPPLVGVSTLEVSGQEFHARVDVHNPNGVEMPVDSLEMAMALGETDLGRHTTRAGITIHPNGTEGIGLNFPATEAARQLLDDLESGRVNSVAYSVNGLVRDSAGGSERFSQQGYLYPVPGRPGQFRGAGPMRDPMREPARDPRNDPVRD